MIIAKRIVAFVVAGFALGTLSPLTALADDAENGEILAYTCLGCHGIDGYRNAYPSYRVPKLGGQKTGYLEIALKAYRSGDRDHPTMQAQGGSLTDQDIADLAAYFQGEEAALDYVTNDMIAGIDAARACLACHGGGVTGLSPTPPTLSGQEESYIQQALNQYKSGQRKNNIMTAFAAALTEADIAAIAKLWSEQDGLYTPQEPD
ncbi:MAG: cytochrome c4 [Woeseia sp.]|nr:cytochrome c4 [Woeseia sp.]MBT8097412.1 cytochrome c4 [Woeseia sp.]NNE60141.1 cytochrome c4 [Woeseia sp.]NNL53847.1 cytochrome c4 [Woeseia sp.]